MDLGARILRDWSRMYGNSVGEKLSVRGRVGIGSMMCCVTRMVWFQCEDCGENLKKPKLAGHFNRCSAHKLSCIDCGVIFDQQSVQYHTSCVSEVEKYGPKGQNKNGEFVVTAKANNSKVQSGPQVDLSRGLSTSSPWFCSICNVKATSRDALELHAQGKKHRSRAKGAAAREESGKMPQGGSLEPTGGFPTNVDEDHLAETNSSVAVSSALAEKKRKKEEVDDPGDAVEEVKAAKTDKKAKKDVKETEVRDMSFDVMRSSSGKKRKHQEHHENNCVQEEKVSAKKSKEKEKLVTENNTSGSATVEDAGIVDHGSKKGNKARDKKDPSSCTDNYFSVKEVSTGVVGVSPTMLPTGRLLSPVEHIDPRIENGTVSSSGRTESGKKSKRAKVLTGMEESTMPLTVKTTTELSTKKSKKEKHRKNESGTRAETPKEPRETIVHEVSFREWLEEDVGVHEGTPTHPPMVDERQNEISHEPVETKNSVEEPVRESKIPGSGPSQTVTKLLKWRKVIREALKSSDGKLKRKELSKAVLPVAFRAAESSSIPLDKKELKAELMRQITFCSKFVVEGKHVLLAPKVN